MKPLRCHRGGSHWLFAACALLYLGLLGPWLVSAANTLAAACGIGLLVALLLFGRTHDKEK